MFERFTKEARAAVVGTHEVARYTGAPAASTPGICWSSCSKSEGRRTTPSGRPEPTSRWSRRSRGPTDGSRSPGASEGDASLRNAA